MTWRPSFLDLGTVFFFQLIVRVSDVSSRKRLILSFLVVCGFAAAAMASLCFSLVWSRHYFTNTYIFVGDGFFKSFMLLLRGAGRRFGHVGLWHKEEERLDLRSFDSFECTVLEKNEL